MEDRYACPAKYDLCTYFRIFKDATSHGGNIAT